MGSFLGIFLLEQCTADGIDVFGGFTWFSQALAIAEKHEDENTIMCISRIPWGWVDARGGRHQIYERRFVDADKRWVEQWFDEAYRPPPEPEESKA